MLRMEEESLLSLFPLTSYIHILVSICNLVMSLQIKTVCFNMEKLQNIKAQTCK